MKVSILMIFFDCLDKNEFDVCIEKFKCFDYIEKLTSVKIKNNIESMNLVIFMLENNELNKCFESSFIIIMTIKFYLFSLTK